VAMADVISTAITFTEQERKRAEVEEKMSDLDREIARNGAMRTVMLRNEKMDTAELAVAQARLAALTEDLAKIQPKANESTAEFNLRAAQLRGEIANLNDRLGEHTAVVGGASDAQLKERDALQATLAEMQRTAEIQAATEAFKSLAKALTEGRLSEYDYLEVTRRLNEQVKVYSNSALVAATSSVLLNKSLSEATGADEAIAALVKYKDALGSVIDLQSLVGWGPGPQAPTGGGGGLPAYQQGGSFIVPPGFAGDRFPMLVSSGERVTVQPAGNTYYQNKVGGDTFNIYDRSAARLMMAYRRQRLAAAMGM